MPTVGPDGLAFVASRRPWRSRFGIWTHSDPRGAWWFAGQGWVRVTAALGGNRAGKRPGTPPSGSKAGFFDVIDSVWTTRDRHLPWFYLQRAWVRLDEVGAWIGNEVGRSAVSGGGGTSQAIDADRDGRFKADVPGHGGAIASGWDAPAPSLRPLVWLARPHERRALAELIAPIERLVQLFAWNRRGIDNDPGFSVIFPCHGVPASWTVPTPAEPRPGSSRSAGQLPAWMTDGTTRHGKTALALISVMRGQAARLLDAMSPPRGTWATLARAHRLLLGQRLWSEARSGPEGSPALWLASEALWALRQVVYPGYPRAGSNLLGPMRRADLALRTPVSRADFEAAKYFKGFQGRAAADWVSWSPGCPGGMAGKCSSCSGCAGGATTCPCAIRAQPTCAQAAACSGCAGKSATSVRVPEVPASHAGEEVRIRASSSVPRRPRESEDAGRARAPERSCSAPSGPCRLASEPAQPHGNDAKGARP